MPGCLPCLQSVQEMEDKHGLRNVWGYTETPALQMMECIDKVSPHAPGLPQRASTITSKPGCMWLLQIKQAMYEKADEEEVNVKTFYALLAAVLVIILFSLLLW